MGRLKSVELYNFKSYKGHQTVDFGDSCFTSIIGPNGAGKSNMMDAISFVLGIRSSHLRSVHLKDLIYRGRVLAEHNDDHISIEPSQISQTVARSAYVAAIYEKNDGSIMELKRTHGASEYKLDGQTVSSNLYAETLAKENILIKAKNFLVFQGDVEAIAAQSPKDLSHLIEQISGSLEFKADYERLRDEKELAANNSTLVFNKKRSYQSNVKQYENEKSKMDLYNQKVEQRDAAVMSHVLWKLFHLENAARTQRESRIQAEAAVKENQRKLNLAETVLETANADYADASKTLQKLTRQQKKLQKSVEDQNTNLLPVNEKLKITQKHHSNHSRRLEEVKGEYDRQNSAVRKLKRDLDIVDKAAAKFEKEAKEELESSKLGKISAAQIEEYDRLKAHLDQQTATEQTNYANIARQLRTVDDKLASLKSKQQVTENSRNRVKWELEDLKTQLSTVSAAINEDNETLKSRKLELNEISVKKQDRTRKESDLNARLQDVTKSLLDYNADLRTSQKEQKLRENVASLKRIIPGVRGLVYDLCKPKQRKYETAVATVLGRDFDSIVVDSFKVAQECISYMKEQRSGVATFIPLDTVVVKPLNTGLRGLDQRVRLAIDTVDYVSAVERAIQYVCSDTLICDDLQVAKQIRWERNIRVKTITLDGGVIHKSNLMSGGKAENNNAQKWEASKVRGLQMLKEKLVKELQELAKKKRMFGPLEESLTGEILALESRLTNARQKMAGIQVSIESRDAELKNAMKIIKELKPSIADLTERSQQLADKAQSIKNSITKAKQKIFADFCESIGIKNIKEYELAHSTSVDELNCKRLEFATQRSRLENQLRFETERLQEIKRRVQSIEGNVTQDLQLLDQLNSEKEIIEKAIASIEMELTKSQSKIDEAARAVDTQLRTVNSCRGNVTDANREVEKNRRVHTTVVATLERLETSRFNILRNCKLEGIEIPLLKGRLDNIPVGEVLARTDAPDADGDVAMDGEDADYGIVVDYETLDEEFKKNSDSSVEEELTTQISSLNTDLNQMVVDVRARERLDDAKSRYDEIEHAADDARKRARETLKEFNLVKDKRTARFMEAYNHISNRIESIYKELTKSKTFPVGGSAYLSLGDEAEPYLDGINYHAMPPMKRFCDMELLSGGEKTMAALALLFAIHSYHPSPFFILDEIDAALDNANVSNIARYIRTHSGNGFQFIVISLKNGLFENSNSLVGIYRDQNVNSSRALTMDLSVYSE